MPERGAERRRHVRLTSRGGTAERFSGRSAGGLPEQAVVADISESGIRLAFAWPQGRTFPLKSGDGLDFQVRIEGSERSLSVHSTVRRVTQDHGRGGMAVGLEFAGLAPDVADAIKRAVLNLAFTKLRSAQEAPPVQPPRTLRSKRASFEDTGKFQPVKPAATQPPAAPPPARTAAPGPAGQPAASGAGDAGKPPPRRRNRQFLGEILVKQGAVEAGKLEEILARGAEDRRPLGQKLAEQGLVDDVAIARALAEQARLPYLDMVKDAPEISKVAAFPREAFVKNRAVPVRDDGQTLLVAMATLPSLPLIERFEAACSRRVRVGIAAERKIAEWLRRLYNVDSVPRQVQLRFKSEFKVEYRFLDSAGQVMNPDREATGQTRDLSARDLTVVGPLPAWITPERIANENLKVEVQVECADILDRIVLGCRPLSVEPSERSGEFVISCFIEQFPPSGQQVWDRLCTLASTIRFRPGKMR
ncbi:MAG TPA: PilZ domain-containing protein [Planctomycetota bacterium]|nr:PilZ domain-containing protein [Planctomycetota bacterium]